MKQRQDLLLLLFGVFVLICSISFTAAQPAGTMDAEQLRIEIMSSPSGFNLTYREILHEDFKTHDQAVRRSFKQLADGLDFYLKGDLVRAHRELAEVSRNAQVSDYADSSLPGSLSLQSILNESSTRLPEQDCSKCGGLGYVDCSVCGGSGWSVCLTCRGDGKIEDRVRYRSQAGQMETKVVEAQCRDCAGLGVRPCEECDMRGIIPCDECGVEKQGSKVFERDVEHVIKIMQIIEHARFIAGGGLEFFSRAGLAVSPKLSNTVEF
ncbi:hypothetical protein STSP2_02691 [Anaerohalosphaera lusitana]|uniref:Chaperone protein DnaJ n=1 Tax=Anaerohalosphaera lusitana TaxID=1936003 RepID=A0A1U9NPG5_9BACT|nr:hypothetical protein [Anaerohalosphaera lusitana]AQT69500.1 hypothetical protein STSP2_02691 [Anaerohalosphaera lusitana]